MASSNNRLVYLAIAWACTFCVGCTDGPFFQLKKINPYIQRQWKQDREKTVVFSQRVEEMRLLRSQIRTMPEEDQAYWIGKLGEIVKTETSPELRREAVLTLAEVHQEPESVTILSQLSKDKNDKVRLAVVSALAGGKDANGKAGVKQRRCLYCDVAGDGIIGFEQQCAAERHTGPWKPRHSTSSRVLRQATRRPQYCNAFSSFPSSRADDRQKVWWRHRCLARISCWTRRPGAQSYAC